MTETEDKTKALPFWDPSRPRDSGSPCWREARSALPDLCLRPSETSLFLFVVGLWLPRGGNVFTWLQVEVPLDEVRTLLLDWAEGPEEALRKWWGKEEPRRQAPWARPRQEPFVVEKSMEELGL